MRIEISSSIRLAAAPDSPLCERISLNPDRSAEIIVGIVRIKVINPAAATAPAPIGRM